MLRKMMLLQALSFRLQAKSILLAVLSGVILALSFINAKLWIYAWFAFVPLFFALQNKSKSKAFLLSYLCGIIFWPLTIYWLIHVTLLGQVLLILYLALYFGIFGLFISCPPSFIHLLFIPGAWVLLEYLRAYLLTGFPWALLGYSQYQNLPVIQIADITGVWGVSFIVMMVNVVIYSFLACRQGGVFGKIKKCSLVLVCVIFTLSYGHYKILRKPKIGNQTPIRISVIQGNIPQELKWDAGAQDFIVQRYVSLTQEAAKDSPDLIIWPEAASPELFGINGPVFKDFFSLSQAEGVPLLVGAVTEGKGGYFNSALLIDRTRLAGRYDKLHLVPFGEYIPLKRLLPFLETVVPIGDIRPGQDHTVFEISNARMRNKFSVLICFEDLFPELSREFVKRGADFLVNITNDAWYKKTSAPYQHLAASVFRAVENRVFLARAANTGVSAFIAPDGKVISAVKDETGAKIFITGYRAQEIRPEKNALTFYTRYGEVFILLLLIFVVHSMLRPK